MAQNIIKYLCDKCFASIYKNRSLESVCLLQDCLICLNLKTISCNYCTSGLKLSIYFHYKTIGYHIKILGLEFNFWK